MTSHRSSNNTSVYLLEQESNKSAGIGSERVAIGTGAEASCIGSLLVRPWSPVPAAAERLTERALRDARAPASAHQIEQAVQRIDHAAQLMRGSVRDQRMPPHVDEVRRSLEAVNNQGLAHMTRENARDKAAEILRGASHTIERARSKIEHDLRDHYAPEAISMRLHRALDADHAGPAEVRGALQRLLAELAAEPETIRNLLEVAHRDAKNEEQKVQFSVRSIPRWGLLDWGNVFSGAQLTISTSIPTLGRARLAAFYLPCVRDALPVVERTTKRAIDRLTERLHAIDVATNTLLIQRQDREQRIHGNRVLLLGVPASEQEAITTALVETCWPLVSRALRDAITRFENAVPAERLLDTLLDIATRAAQEHAPPLTLDDALFQGRDPVNVAHELGARIDGMRMPLAMLRGVADAKLRDRRCTVVNVPRGSRLRECLATHAGMRGKALAESNVPNQAEVLYWQLGCSIEETELYRQGIDEHAREVANRAAPPIHTLALEALTYTSAPATLPGGSASATGLANTPPRREASNGHARSS